MDTRVAHILDFLDVVDPGFRHTSSIGSAVPMLRECLDDINPVRRVNCFKGAIAKRTCTVGSGVVSLSSQGVKWPGGDGAATKNRFYQGGGGGSVQRPEVLQYACSWRSAPHLARVPYEL